MTIRINIRHRLRYARRVQAGIDDDIYDIIIMHFTFPKRIRNSGIFNNIQAIHTVYMRSMNFILFMKIHLRILKNSLRVCVSVIHRAQLPFIFLIFSSKCVYLSLRFTFLLVWLFVVVSFAIDSSATKKCNTF